jgi:hypothetical protein
MQNVKRKTRNDELFSETASGSGSENHYYSAFYVLGLAFKLGGAL